MRYDFHMSTRFCVLLAFCVAASAQTITSLDFPGALATTAFAINDSGVITGIYGDNAKAAHFYVRSSIGKYTSFDVPGVHPNAPGLAINKSGVIAGWDSDSGNVHHGFVRAANGTITTFDFPGAGNAAPVGINANCVIAGFYSDAKGTSHGFLRIPAGCN